MQTVMVNHRVVYSGRNADVAATYLHSAIGALYPDADGVRAVRLFKAGTSVTVGCISGLSI